MGILARRTTLADFTSGTVPVTRSANTTAAQKAPYCAEGINLRGDDPGHVETFTPLSEGWIREHYYTGSNANVGTNVFVLSANATDLLRIQATSVNTFKFEYWNGSAWVIIASGISWPNAVLRKLDIHWKLDNVSGIFELFMNDVSQGSFSGDTILTAETQCNRVLTRSGSSTISGITTYSGFIVADEDTRALIYSQTPIGAAGTNTAWTGDATAIDETGVNDADFISSDTAGQVETVQFGDLNAVFATGHDILEVAVTPRAAKGGAGPGFIKPVVQSGATLGEGASQACDITWAPKPHGFTVDPNTGVAWTYAGVNAAEIGVKSAAA